MIDVTQLDARPAAEEGRWLQLLHPTTGKQIPARLLLQGVDSETYKSKHLEQRRARLDMFAATGSSRMDPAAVDEEDLERLVAVTAGWEGIARGDEPWAFSKAAARELYLTVPDFRLQALVFITSRANFLPPSAKDSSPSQPTSSASRDG